MAGFEGPVYERALGKLRRFAAREWSNPAWFLPPEAVGERVWKVRGLVSARTDVCLSARSQWNACFAPILQQWYT